MTRATIREATVLLIISALLGLAYNAIVGKGIFGPSDLQARPSPSQDTLPSADIIAPEMARQLFEAGSATFIDTRHAFDFRLEHIPGAINIPLKEAEALIRNLDLAKDRTVVVYCDGAECNSSLEVSSVLIMEGFTDVRIFFSGWQAWKEMEYETESSSK